LPTLNPEAGKVKIARLRAYARDDRTFGGVGPPMVAYRFEDSRSGDRAARQATIGAFCNAMAMPDIASSPAALIPMECGSRDAGHAP
jgi:hypothetical protein